MSTQTTPSAPPGDIEELVALIEDAQTLSDHEKSELVAEVRANGVSAELRPRLAAIFEEEERLLGQDLADQGALIVDIDRQISAPPDAEEAAAINAIVEEAAREQDTVMTDLRSAGERVVREVEAQAEGASEQGNQEEVERLRRELKGGNGTADQ